MTAMAIILTGPSREEERAPDGSGSALRARPAMVAIAALIVLGAITVGRPQAPSPTGDPSLAIPPSVAITPLLLHDAGRWVQTGLATGEPRRATRSSVGYVLPDRDGVVIITDDDRSVRVPLPDLETVRGITADASRIVVYGQSPAGPALWESPDGSTWTLHRLPWQGSVRMATLDGGRLMVFGITPDRDGLTGVIAIEGTSAGGWDLTPAPPPPSRVLGIPGAFVIRDRHPDDGDYRYYATADMVLHEPFADRLLISSAGLTAGVIDTAAGPRLVAPPLETVIDPPEWPVVALWQEGTRIWLQSAESVWTSFDGLQWDEISLDRTVWDGVAIALPVGEDPRVVVSEGTGVLRIFRWTQGSA